MKNKPVWIVETVEAHEDYTLHLTFADGKRGVYDFKPNLQKPICAPLRHLPLFLAAKAEGGTVVWNDDLDIAPEFLYENCLPERGEAHA